MASATIVMSGAALAQSNAAGVLEANLAASGAAPSGAGAVRAVYAFEGMGLNGGYSSLDDLRDGRFVDILTAGPATQTQGFDGAHAWQKDASGTVTRQDGGDQRQSAVSEAYRQANLWWRADRGGAAIVYGGVKQDGGSSFDVLTVTPRGGKPFDAWFDGKAHLLARTVEKQGSQTVTTTYSDYRPVEGAMLAHKAVIDDGSGAKYAQTLTLTEVHFLPPPDGAVFAEPKIAVADFSIDGGASETMLPFRLIDNRVYAEVSVNGKGPFLFIFDTGSSNAIDSATAKALGIAVQGAFDEHGAGVGVMEAGFAKISELKVADAHMRDQVFEVFPNALSNVEGLDDKGIVGFETFRRFVTRIDYGQKTITLVDPKRFDPRSAGTPIHFDFEGNALVAAGVFEGSPGRFIIDTGSRGEVILNKPFAERNGLRAKHAKGVEAVVGWGTGGPGRAYVLRGASLGIGPIEIPNVVTALTTQDKGVFAGSDFDGDIGGGVLERFVVTFDYEHQTMYLKPVATPLRDVGTYDRAGMWFNVSADGFRIVDVTPAGPAEAAGLAAGDQITAIDGKAAKAVTVYDLRRRLRTGAPGAVVTFTVMRDGRSLARRVTLRDLI